MARYTFRYCVVEDWKATFEAENLEQAKALLQQVIDEAIELDDLPEFANNNKAIRNEFEVSYIEETE